MRIIHTADWHLGQTLQGHDREHEHRAALASLTRVIVETKANALIVAGDVFDSQNPSGSAQALLYETLANLHRARPGLQIILTAGNHDAAGRLEAPRALMGAVNTLVVGNVRRHEGVIDGRSHVIGLRGDQDHVEAHVLAVSYPTAGCLPSLTRLDSDEGSPVVAATKQLYEELIGQARPKLGGLPLIVTGHLHVQGAVESEGAERRILVGGQHAVPADIFPPDLAYVALGHLHKRQAVGRETIRYSGSLFPLSATEMPYQHGVTLVTLEAGQVRHEHIPLARPVAFLRVPESGETTLGELPGQLAALNLDASLAPNLRPFLQIALKREGLSVNFRTEIDTIAEGFPVRLLPVTFSHAPDVAAASLAPKPTVRLADLRPDDLFLEIFKRAHGAAPDLEHLDAFHRSLASAGTS